MSDLAVDVQNVSKRFRLYHERYNSLKEKIIHAGRTPYTDLWALGGVTFEVPEGKTVGILGRNGSGKSTLLKCVCGVLQPTGGQVVVRGKLAGLLELGAGFQQDLSGRDNIYLNGSMLGLSKKEVDRVFDAVVDFAELEPFIDNQVKFYSSGMYVRLGFAVAVNVDPDVLVIDEVLAVGDEKFQRKCIERVKQFQTEGRTILLVTHSPDQVRAICDTAVVLNSGRLIGQGETGECIRLFREALMESDDVLSVNESAPEGFEATSENGHHPPPKAPPAPSAPDAAEVPSAGTDSGTFTGPPSGLQRRVPKKSPPDADHPVRLTSVDLEYPESQSRHYLRSGEPLSIRVGFDAFRATDDVAFVVELRNIKGELVARVDTDVYGERFSLASGPGAISVTFTSVPMLDGIFEIQAGVQNHGGVLYDWWQQAGAIEVMNPTRKTGFLSLPTTVRLLDPVAAAASSGWSS